MKQIDECLDRFFGNQPPLKRKWQAVRHPDKPQCFCLFHYHHLVLIYNTVESVALYQWWELPADKRGLDAALEYLERRSTNLEDTEVQQLSLF